VETTLNIEYRHLVQNNLEAYWKTCYSTNPLYRVSQKNNILCAESDINDPLFNAVLHCSAVDKDATETINSTLQYFTEKNLSFCWWVDTSSHSLILTQDLEKTGFKLYGHVSGMALEIHKAVTPFTAPENIQIMPVTTLEDLQQWAHPIQQGFGMSEQSIAKYLAIFQKSFQQANSPFLHYIAKSQNQVIGSGTLYRGETAGIYNCATLSECRGIGVMTSLTTAMLAQAKESGYTQITLQASPASVGVFRQCGFVDVIPYQVYLKAI
jgi:hypothetical protein